MHFVIENRVPWGLPLPGHPPEAWLPALPEPGSSPVSESRQ